MKTSIFALALCALSLTLFSFDFDSEGVTYDPLTGNYTVPDFGIVSEPDANQLDQMTIQYGTSETQVIHESVKDDWVKTTIWEHKDKAVFVPNPGLQAEVDAIMQPYLN